MKNNFVKLSLVLFIISAVSAGALAFLNDFTKEIIAANDAKASMDPAVIQAVMPGATMFKDLEDKAIIDTIKSENAKFVDLKNAVDNSGNVLGYVVRTLSTIPGYGGDIEMFVGITPDGKISGLNVLAHQETSGLGSKVTEPQFKDQFVGKDATKEITDGDYDALTGATKSSVSFSSGVNNAISIYNQHLKK